MGIRPQRERVAALPAECHHRGRVGRVPFGFQRHGFQFLTLRIPFIDPELEAACFPAFAVADHHFPAAGSRRSEALGIIGRKFGLQAEDLDQSACVFLEQETGGNDLRIVEDHQRFFREIIGQVAEFSILRASSAAICIDKKLRIIALRQRITGNAVFREVICVIFDANILDHRAKFSDTKIQLCRRKYKFNFLNEQVYIYLPRRGCYKCGRDAAPAHKPFSPRPQAE